MIRGLSLLVLMATFLSAEGRNDANVTVVQVAPLATFHTQQSMDAISIYKCTFPDASNQVAAVTLIPSLVGVQNSYIKIANSLHSIQFELDANATDCMVKGPTTCLTNLSDHSPTVYVSVYTNIATSYSLSFSLPTLTDQMQVGSTYINHFEQQQTKVYEIDLQELSVFGEVSELTLIMQYTKLDYPLERQAFSAVAALDSLPNWSSQVALLSSRAAGVDTQILILPVPSLASKYYVTLSSPNNNTINSQIKITRPPSLSVNEAVTHFTINSIQHTSPIPDETSNLSMQMNIYAGDGSITVQYCGQILPFIYFGLQGMAGVLELSQELMSKCRQLRSNNTKDVNNSLAISVFTKTGLTYFLGFYQHPSSAQQVITPGMQLYSTLTYDNRTRNHTLRIIPGSNYVLTVQLQQTGNLFTNTTMTVTSYICPTDGQQKCTEQSTNPSRNGLLIINSLNSLNHCYVQVSVDEWKDDPQTILTYTLSLRSEHSVSVLPDGQKLSQEIVYWKENRCYSIDLQQLYSKNNWKSKEVQITVEVGVINGYTNVYASTHSKCDRMAHSSPQLTDTVFGRNGYLTIDVLPNSSNVNIAVVGQQTSVYDISYSASVINDLQPGMIILSDNQAMTLEPNSNNFSVLAYAAHIIPYDIQLSGTPQCFRYGPSLQLISEQCTIIPNSLTLSLTDLYINITHTAQVLIEVKTVSFNLRKDSPLWINCAFYCWAEVVLYLEEPATVVHKGEGSVIFESTYYIEDELSIRCDSYPCTKILNATLEQNSMYLWLKSQNIVMPGIEQVTLGFSQYQEVLYEVKPWKGQNCILVTTHSHKVKAYYQIMPNKLLENHVQTFMFPQHHTIKKLEGTPLKNTFVISIPKHELKQIDCIQHNQVRCIVTIRMQPDYSMPYDPSVSSLTGIISANVYRESFALNNIQLMAETTGPYLIYFSHKLAPNLTSIAPKYFLTVETLASCAPAIFQPTQYLDHDTPVFNRAVLIPVDGWINFTLIDDRACLFQFFVSSMDIPFLLADTLYNLQVENDMGFSFIFHSKGSAYSTYFTVIYKGPEGDNATKILASKVTKSGEYVIPSDYHHDFRSEYSNRLQIEAQVPQDFYVIMVVAPAHTVFELIVRTQGAIIMKNGLKYYGGNWLVQDDDRERVESYKLWIMSSWVLMMSSSSVVKMQVYDYQSELLDETAVLNGEDSSLSFTPVKQLDNYLINITTLSVNRSDNYLLQFYDRLLTPLYDGIVVNGVLMHMLDMRCYQYTTPDLASADSTVRLTIIYEQMKNQVLLLDASIDGGQFTTQKINFKSRSIHTYSMPFKPSVSYQICYQAYNLQSAGQPYRLILQHSQDSSTLLPSTPVTSPLSPKTVNHYMLLHPTDTPALITLTPCQEQFIQQSQQLFYYQDYQSMKDDQRQNSTGEVFRNAGLLYSKVTPSTQEGYLYLGVESLQRKPYRVGNQPIASAQSIRARQWDLPENVISNISVNQTGRVNVALPKITTSTNSTAPVSVTYTAYLIDLDQYSSTTSIDTQARCPSLAPPYFQHEQSESSGLWVSEVTQDYKRPSELTSPTLTFPTGLPDLYNLTAKVTVVTHGQTIEHYYAIHTNIGRDGSIPKPSSIRAATCTSLGWRMILILRNWSINLRTERRLKLLMVWEVHDVLLPNFSRTSSAIYVFKLLLEGDVLQLAIEVAVLVDHLVVPQICCATILWFYCIHSDLPPIPSSLSCV